MSARHQAALAVKIDASGRVAGRQALERDLARDRDRRWLRRLQAQAAGAGYRLTDADILAIAETVDAKVAERRARPPTPRLVR